MIAATAAVCVLLMGAAEQATAPGTAALETYVSEVDGSRQSYGIYVPKRPPPSAAGFPLVVHGHGYGWHVSAGFNAFQRRWADEHGWLLVNCNGRGPTFYDGIGENDLLQVIADADRRYGVDRTRVYFTGGSMGGTGALRHGVRHPDIFAAVVSVDGWSDYRLWHRHWYARTDDPTSIEEFRRPLLEAAAPLFTAPTARSGHVGIICDSADPIVWPDNSRLLREALATFEGEAPHQYRHAFVENVGYGHGAGSDLRAIYRYFATRTLDPEPRRVRCVTTQLKYGRVHWIRVDRFRVQGLRGDLRVEADGATVTVSTDNLTEFSLFLDESPLRGERQVTVIADGRTCYRGPPATVTLAAEFGQAGRPPTWRLAQATEGLRKTAELEGPIGHAFVKPFIIAYGTAGTPAETGQNRSEAQQLAKDWNRMFVHYDCVRPVPEEQVTADDLARKSLILFGTEDSSALLRQAMRSCDLPVRVDRKGVLVRDDDYGDRHYTGPDFGAFFVYPNPLSDFRTYLVVSHGSYIRDEAGTDRRGLGYDLEKLPWGWPDYVVFNSNRDELPLVGNVNNKKETILYEAAYFVEAGYFDQDWQPKRDVVLNWVEASGRGGSYRAHVAEVKLEQAGEGGYQAKVKVVEGRNRPVRQARVTGQWLGLAADTLSGVTGQDGIVVLRAPALSGADGLLRFRLLNVMATGLAYDFRADKARGGQIGLGDFVDLVVESLESPGGLQPGDVVRVVVAVRNLGTRRTSGTVRLMVSSGHARPKTQKIELAGGQTRRLLFWWDTESVAPGEHVVSAHVSATEADANLHNNQRQRVVELQEPMVALGGP